MNYNNFIFLVKKTNIFDNVQKSNKKIHKSTPNQNLSSNSIPKSNRSSWSRNNKLNQIKNSSNSSKIFTQNEDKIGRAHV